MKKIFFASLLATVAVGGAYATDYSTQPHSGGTKFKCGSIGAPTCLSVVGPSTTLYLIPGDQPTTPAIDDYNHQLIFF